MVKDIQGYENLYTIDDKGNVFSFRSNRYLKWHDDGSGYQYVQLFKNGKRKCKKVHRLVAEHFLKNPDNLPQVNHKNENKKNNSVDNLEWCTANYNNNYGNRIKKATQSNLNNPAFSKKVIAINKITGEKIVFPSAREGARYVGDVKKSSNIVACLMGRQKSAYGYFWKYFDENY